MPLTDTQVAAIVFNETRSLSGPGIERARTNIAHTAFNAEAKSLRRPKSAPTSARVPKQESDIYAACAQAVAAAKKERADGKDPTSGATNFNFRKNTSRADFFGIPIRTQEGPFANSYPTADLPATGIYANTYGK